MATPETLTIRTDQGDVQLPAGSTLADAVTRILHGQGTTPEQVATAVNGQFVARSARTGHALQDGDAVLCFSPITGG
jgi:sulfur carrier protein